jgi:HK97 family phage major capsid protein
MTLEQLRARLKELTGASEQIVSKASAESRRLTVEELDGLEATAKEVETIEREIKALERVAVSKAAAAVPATATQEATVLHAEVKKDLKATEKLGIMCLSLLKAKSEGGGNALHYMEEMGYGDLAKEISTFRKTLNVSNAAAGGIVVPTPVSSELVELLRPNTVFLQGGPTRIEMPNGSFKMPRAVSGSSASYSSEAEPAARTEPTFGSIEMTAKTLKAIVPVTNDFLNWSLASAQSFVTSDLVAAMSEKMDTAMFRGDGLQGNPLGLFNVAGITSNPAVNSTTPTIANIDSDARKCMNGLLLNYVPANSAKWVMSQRSFGYLQDIRDGNGNLAYPSLQGANPTFKGFPVLVTTNLPTNLGGGTDETFIAFIGFQHVLFGEAGPITLASSSEGMIENGSSPISLFQRGMTAILATAQHDIGLRQLKAVSVLTAVRW